MKTILLLGSILITATLSQAQYAIDWFTLDGGGGQSSGGAYALSGTIGQPDAAMSSGGVYTLQGGFWSAVAVVPTEDAPWLRIARSDAKVVLAWPNPSTGFHLQESVGLTAPNWTDVNSLPNVIGDEKQVSQALAPGTRFYRLRKP